MEQVTQQQEDRLNSFKFGKKYDEYLIQASKKVVELENRTRIKNGVLLVDFDDYETDIIEQYQGIAYGK